MTLYWFVPDTSTASRCTGSCATYWPPLIGPVTAGSGVTGMLATVTRPGGAIQVTYDGHPLYTYAGDSAPGQAKGNGLNVSGGVWWEMTVSGAKPATSTSSNTSSNTGGGSTGGGGMSGSGGGGYGY
jgi:predicted lipoprotein with Yx(FWY)xxD motif